ncbi:hypothetical protein chiPu_0030701, partial [Chiloscyllium punctatum]|nr:hypothetical protein [Chiloscyllium punctatum]
MAGAGDPRRRSRCRGRGGPLLSWRTCYLQALLWLLSVCGEERTFIVE